MAHNHRPNPRGLNQHTAGVTGMISGAPPPRTGGPRSGVLNQHTGGITGMVTGPPPPSQSSHPNAAPAYLRVTGPLSNAPPNRYPTPGYGGGPRGPPPRGPPPGGYQPRPYRPNFSAGPPPQHNPQTQSRPRFTGANTESWRRAEEQKQTAGGKFGFPGVRPSSPTPMERDRAPAPPRPPSPGNDERDQVEDARALARKRALAQRADLDEDEASRDSPSPPPAASKLEPFGGAAAAKAEPMGGGSSAKQEPASSDILAKLKAAGLVNDSPTKSAGPAVPAPTEAAQPALTEKDKDELLGITDSERERLQAEEKARKRDEERALRDLVDVKPNKAELDAARGSYRPGPLSKKMAMEDSKTGVKVKTEKVDKGYQLADTFIDGKRIKGEKFTTDEMQKAEALYSKVAAEIDSSQPVGLGEEEEDEETKDRRRNAILARMAQVAGSEDYASEEARLLESERAALGDVGVGGTEWARKLQTVIGGDDDTEDADDEPYADTSEFGKKLAGLLGLDEDGEGEEGAEAPVLPRVEKPSRTSRTKGKVTFRSGGQMRVLLPKIKRRDYIRCAPNLKLYRIMLNPPDIRVTRLSKEEIHFWTKSNQEPYAPIRNDEEYKGLGLELGLDNSTMSVTHRQREEAKRRQADMMERRRRLLQQKEMEARARLSGGSTSISALKRGLPSHRDSDRPPIKKPNLSGKLNSLPSFKKKPGAASSLSSARPSPLGGRRNDYVSPLQRSAPNSSKGYSEGYRAGIRPSFGRPSMPAVRGDGSFVNMGAGMGGGGGGGVGGFPAPYRSSPVDAARNSPYDAFSSGPNRTPIDNGGGRRGPQTPPDSGKGSAPPPINPADHVEGLSDDEA